MTVWTTLLNVLALTSTAVACAHHHDGDVVPEYERAELLKKWDQEVPNTYLQVIRFNLD